VGVNDARTFFSDESDTRKFTPPLPPPLAGRGTISLETAPSAKLCAGALGAVERPGQGRGNIMVRLRPPLRTTADIRQVPG
jgi:hypothetical protein